MSNPKVDWISAANFTNITSVYKDDKANLRLWAPIACIYCYNYTSDDVPIDEGWLKQ